MLVLMVCHGTGVELPIDVPLQLLTGLLVSASVLATIMIFKDAYFRLDENRTAWILFLAGFAILNFVIGVINIVNHNVLKDGVLSFMGCTNLTEANLPNSIIIIEAYAFCGCKGIKGSLNLPPRLKTLGYYAFYECEGLTGDVVIPDSVTRFEPAFTRCKGLDGTFYLPDGVEWDGQMITETNIQSISVNDTNEMYKVYDGILYDKNLTKALFCPASRTGTVTFPETLTEIGDHSFRMCSKLEGDICLPAGVKKIGEFAFDQSGFDGKLYLPEIIKQARKLFTVILRKTIFTGRS